MRAELASELEASRLRDLMHRLQVNPNLSFLDCHALRAAADIALLVEPINGNPYIFVPPNRVFTFDSVAGSGTDRLRKRIDADLFFRRIVDRHHAQAQRAEQEGSGHADPASQEEQAKLRQRGRT
jgi:hypothetical protein